MKIKMVVLMLCIFAYSMHAMEDGSESSSDGCTSEELQYLPNKLEDDWLTVTKQSQSNKIIPAAATALASSATLVAGSCLRNPYLVSTGLAGLAGAAKLSLSKPEIKINIDNTKIGFNNPIKKRKFLAREKDAISSLAQDPENISAYTDELRERMKIKKKRRMKQRNKK